MKARNDPANDLRTTPVYEERHNFLVGEGIDATLADEIVLRCMGMDMTRQDFQSLCKMTRQQFEHNISTGRYKPKPGEHGYGKLLLWYFMNFPVIQRRFDKYKHTQQPHFRIVG